MTREVEISENNGTIKIVVYYKHRKNVFITISFLVFLPFSYMGLDSLPYWKGIETMQENYDFLNDMIPIWLLVIFGHTYYILPWVITISEGVLAIKWLPFLFPRKYRLEHMDNFKYELVPIEMRTRTRYNRRLIFEYMGKKIYFGANMSEEAIVIVIQKIKDAQAAVKK